MSGLSMAFAASAQPKGELVSEELDVENNTATRIRREDDLTITRIYDFETQTVETRKR